MSVEAIRLLQHPTAVQFCQLVGIMARRSARIMARELAKLRKQQVSSPNISQMRSGKDNLSLDQFPLMDLPREVRDMIYEACLAVNGAIFVREQRPRGLIAYTFKRRQREDFDRRMLSIQSSATAESRDIFYVSKQIRDEAVAIFYRKNRFEFTTLNEMETFILNIRRRERHNLRSVIVYYEGYHDSYAHSLRVLARCVGLRDLTLVLCDACMKINYGNSIYSINGHIDRYELLELQAFETLLEIRGLSNVRLVPSEKVLKSPHDVGELPAMETAVQVLKQPRPAPRRSKRNVVAA